MIDLWTRPLDASDIFDEDMNCSIERDSNNSANVTAIYDLNISAGKLDDALSTAMTVDGVFSLHKPAIKKVLFEGKVVSGKLLELILNTGLENEVDSYCIQSSKVFWCRFQTLSLILKCLTTLLVRES